MLEPQNIHFSQAVTVFQEIRLPEKAIPVGYAALIEAFDLKVPLPFQLCAIGTRHKIYQADNWRIYTPRHEPDASVEGHLIFALKYEGVELLILKRLFTALPPQDVERMIREKPTSSYMRRIWFLYEWLMGASLSLENAKTGSYVDALDTKLQYGGVSENSTRHRVRNNLPGLREFCPLIRRTAKLQSYRAADLQNQAQQVIGRISKNVLSRTAAFLLLKDSKSSYAIEGEAPPQDRLQRWGKVIGEAGKNPLDMDEFLRLQKIVFGKDTRFITLGFRQEGGFVGEHEYITRLPLPDHISAKYQDIENLMSGVIEFYEKAGVQKETTPQAQQTQMDPVLTAAALAFGFIYIHPFEDGNGRLHRYLIHHVLTAQGFTPPGIIFPVSAVILDRLVEYRQVLESYSTRLLPLIDWRPTEEMNVDVLNDTVDYYRYFDATTHAEFLYSCVEHTIIHDLPDEAAFLESYDQFKTQIEAMIDMSASKIDLLFNFLRQNNGALSKRALTQEFAQLRKDEIEKIEGIYRIVFF